MSEAETRARIREILKEAIADPQALDRVADRIMEAVSPFQSAAREELERYRATFAELAK